MPEVLSNEAMDNVLSFLGAQISKPDRALLIQKISGKNADGIVDDSVYLKIAPSLVKAHRKEFLKEALDSRQTNAWKMFRHSGAKIMYKNALYDYAGLKAELKARHKNADDKTLDGMMEAIVHKKAAGRFKSESYPDSMVEVNLRQSMLRKYREKEGKTDQQFIEEQKEEFTKLREMYVKLARLITKTEGVDINTPGLGKKSQFSKQDYRNWALLFAHGEEKHQESIEGLKIGVTRAERNERLEFWAQVAFVVVNILATAMAVVALHGAPSHGFGSIKSTDDLTASGNAIDGLFFLYFGVTNIMRGEPALGFTQLGVGSALIATQVIGIIGQFGVELMPELASAGMLGFSYAGALFAMAGLELFHARRASKKIKALSAKIEALDKEIASVDLDELDVQVNEIDKHLGNVQKEMSAIAQERAENSSSLRSADASLREIEGNLKSLDDEIKAKSGEIEQLEEHLKDKTLSKDDRSALQGRYEQAHLALKALKESRKPLLDEQEQAVKHMEELQGKEKSLSLANGNLAYKKEALMKKKETIKGQKSSIIASCPGGEAEVRDKHKELVEDRALLQKVKFHEMANRHQHMRQAKLWAASGLAMGLVATAAYIGLSGITLGALPVATVVITAFAVGIGLIRTKLSRQSHVETLKSKAHVIKEFSDIMAEADTLAEMGLDIKQSVHVKGKEVSFASYLEKMVPKDPAKAERIINVLKAYKNADNAGSRAQYMARLEKEVSAKRHGLDVVHSKTTGRAILDKMQSDGPHEDEGEGMHVHI